MQIGLISDTHDNIEAIAKAVQVFNEREVELVLHAGDYTSPFTAENFRDLKARLVGVYGNVDGERKGLHTRYSEIGAEIEGDFAEIPVEDSKILLLHGTDPFLIEALAESGRYTAIIHGHTHRQRCDRVKRAVIVNPGEACGYLTGIRSLAVLETETQKVEFIQI